MKLTSRSLALLSVAALAACNLSLAAGASAAAVIACNLVLVAVLAAAWRALTAREHRLQQIERRYQSLRMVAEDQEVEARILEVLSQISVEFLSKMQLRPLLERISEAIHDVLEVDVSVIEVLPEAGGQPVRLLRGGTDLAFGRDCYNEVVFKGKSLLVNNLANYPHYVTLGSQSVRSMILAPLTLHNRAIGLIGACTATQRGFTSRHLRQLYSFANHAALLIETTRLLRSVQKLSVKQPADGIEDLKDLAEHLRAERQVEDREMEVARRIQTALLPRTVPMIPGAAVEGASSPAREVGGDYYDFLDLGGGRWGIAIADVSGKGVPAALVMVMTRTLLHALARASELPAEVLTALNADLYKETDPSVFVSMLYGIWDGRTRTFTYSNAGHEPPILVQKGAARALPTGGVALGAIEHAGGVLENQILTLDAGDSLLLFTDGATEARNASREMFGAERLQQAYAEAAARPAGRVVSVLARIREFTGTSPQHDDITFISFVAV